MFGCSLLGLETSSGTHDVASSGPGRPKRFPHAQIKPMNTPLFARMIAPVPGYSFLMKTDHLTLIRSITPASRHRNSLNFSGGPGALPDSVLQQVQESILAVPEVGLSILGISHRSDWFAGVVAELESNIRSLMGLPSNYHVLFLQGGATQQFSMVPMTLLRGKAHAAEYLHTGYWTGKAIPEAQREGPVRTVWSGEGTGFTRLPTDDELDFDTDAPYLHYASNETVEGLQFHRVIGRDGVPRICDMSSDFLAGPGEFERFSLIYAHAQKNIGPAGVTVVVVKDELLEGAPTDLPGFLDYRAQIEAHSIFNTPPVFAIYVILLVTRWLRGEIGGLEAMGRINTAKSDLLYHALDRGCDFYQPRAHRKDRSRMNVTFTLPSAELESEFLEAAAQAGMSGLGGHRSVGGIRASLYNGLTISSVETLVSFMEEFRWRHR
jgi:phosphoserine aminotransferase